jgi:hypothetical protein
MKIPKNILWNILYNAFVFVHDCGWYINMHCISTNISRIKLIQSCCGVFLVLFHELLLQYEINISEFPRIISCMNNH